MSVETPEELEALRAAGRVVAEALAAMGARAAPGVSTAELDAVAERIFRRAGARSGPRLDYGFPGATCISVNDEAVHGIPGPRRLRPGDLVKLDVTAELDGFYADACVSIALAPVAPAIRRLLGSARRALAAGIGASRAGAPLNAIGAAVESAASAGGHAVCAELMGHGIGRRIHEPPDVPNCFVAALAEPLAEGLVLTVEPILAEGAGAIRSGEDGWTLCTRDGSAAAHFEHTIVVTASAPLVLTA